MIRVINKNYDRNIKEILGEPTRRYPHTRVISSIHLSPTTGGINPEYSIVLSKTYPIGEKKRLQGYASYLVCGLHLQKALLSVRLDI